MSPLVFLDANVFMYAAGSDHPYKTPCLNILSDVEAGILTATVNTEILQEILYRYSHVNLTDKEIQLCRSILKYPLTILPITAEDVRQAVDQIPFVNRVDPVVYISAS